jgi:hypothetical protein
MKLKVKNLVNGGFEGVVSIDGLRPTKLVKTSDQSTTFTTRSGVTQSAQALAKRFGDALVIDDDKNNKKKVKAVQTVSMSSSY